MYDMFCLFLYNLRVFVYYKIYKKIHRDIFIIVISMDANTLSTLLTHRV